MGEVRITDEMVKRAWKKLPATLPTPDQIRGALESVVNDILSGLAEPVKVKPLEWEEYVRNPFQWISDYYLVAGDALGRHWVHHRIHGDLRGGDGKVAFYKTSNEAKAAAQVDHERRILSALATPPASDLREENERLRKALQSIADVDFSGALDLRYMNAKATIIDRLSEIARAALNSKLAPAGEGEVQS